MPDFSLLSGHYTEVAINAATSEGIAVPVPGAAHTKGAWTEAIAATLHPTAWVIVQLSFGGTAGRGFLDVGIGAVGVEKVLIPDLYMDLLIIAQSLTRRYILPVSIPAGSRLSLRHSNSTNQNYSYGLNLIAPTAQWPNTLQRVEASGIDIANSRLVALEDPGGTAHTDSAWKELIASTSFPYQWVCLAVGHAASTTGQTSNMLFDIGIGSAGNEKVLIPDFYVRNGTVVDSPPVSEGFPLYVPAGSRLSARFRNSNTTATDRIHDLGLWGVG